MSVQSEITRLENAKAAIKAAIEGKGVTVPDATLLDGMASLIESIEAGGGYKVAKGTFIPSETVSINLPPLSIEHNAGFKPDVFIFYRATSGTYGMLSLVATWNILFGDGVTDSYSCYTMIKGTSSMGEGELVSYKPTENVAYIRSNITPHKVTAGQEYRWIAIGGIE